MANSYVVFPSADGGTTDYSIPFEYLSTDHVKATVNGVEASFTFLSTYMIQFDTAPNGYLKIYRETPSGTLINTYFDGSVLIDDDLNESFYQALSINEESQDQIDNAILLDGLDGKYDANSKVIKNVATPVADTDAVNKAYADSVIATAEAAAAVAANLAVADDVAATASDAADAASAAAAAAASETAAATSETNASSFAAAAQAARDATLAAYDNFDDRYLGAKATEPSVDNDGNALVAGSLFFDTTSGYMKVYTGSAWVAAYVSGSDYALLIGADFTGNISAPQVTANNGIMTITGAAESRVTGYSTDGWTYWMGIPSWDTDGFYIYGPASASGAEWAAKYSQNKWSWATGGTERMTLDSNGNLAASTGAIYPDANQLSGSMYLGGLGGNPIIQFDANDYWLYDKTGNTFYSYIGGQQKLAFNGTRMYWRGNPISNAIYDVAVIVADWNDATNNGWYRASDGANAPDTGWFMGMVMNHGGAGWVTQEVHGFTMDSSADTLTYRREKNNGTWGSWYRVYKTETEINSIVSAGLAVQSTASLPAATADFSLVAGKAHHVITLADIDCTSNADLDFRLSADGGSTWIGLTGRVQSIEGLTPSGISFSNDSSPLIASDDFNVAGQIEIFIGSAGVFVMTRTFAGDDRSRFGYFWSTTIPNLVRVNPTGGNLTAGSSAAEINYLA